MIEEHEIYLTHPQKVALLQAVNRGKINLQAVFGTLADNCICENCQYRPQEMTREEAEAFLRYMEENY